MNKKKTKPELCDACGKDHKIEQRKELIVGILICLCGVIAICIMLHTGYKVISHE